MLVLTRNIGETITIGDDITVTILGVQGNQVRLGTRAPKNVSVHREEIYQRIQAEKANPTAKPWSREDANADAWAKARAEILATEESKAPKIRVKRSLKNLIIPA